MQKGFQLLFRAFLLHLLDGLRQRIPAAPEQNPQGTVVFLISLLYNPVTPLRNILLPDKFHASFPAADQGPFTQIIRSWPVSQELA